VTRFMHGYSGTPSERSATPEYLVWQRMRDRCNNASAPNFKNYGGRGIRVCQRWDNFASFLADLGPRPSPLHSIDRRDNDGHYEPGNCRWVTKTEQLRNTRVTRFLTFNGRTLSVAGWAEELGISAGTIRARLHRGKSPAEALRIPQ
jgi:hypothetical protein